MSKRSNVVAVDIIDEMEVISFFIPEEYESMMAKHASPAISTSINDSPPTEFRFFDMCTRRKSKCRYITNMGCYKSLS